MTITCPGCRTEIPLADVNVSTDLALCRRCARHFSYAELVAGPAGVDLSRPPSGCWFRREHGGFELGATTRSPLAFFLAPFMLVWSGGSLSTLYGSQLTQGRFELGPALFGVPFLLGSVLLGSVVAMMIAGKVVLRVEGDDASVFTGVGALGWRRRFSWREMTSVRTTQQHGGRGALRERLTLEGQRRVDFATFVNADRRYFMEACVRKMLQERR